MRNKHWILTATVIFCSATVHGVFAQDQSEKPLTPASQRSELPAIDLTALKQTFKEIKKTRPDIPEHVLFADLQIIESALPQIETEFGTVGLSNDHALWASQRAWRAARLESPLRYAPEKVIDNTSFIEHITGEIAPRIVRWQILQQNPSIYPYVLEKDLRLINFALPDITKSFREDGWTATDARNASLFVWKSARIETPLKPQETIDVESLVEAAENLAIVVFTSEPDQAQVFMGTENVGTTNKEKKKPIRFFLEDTQMKVVFKKPDYVSREAVCEAKLGETKVCKVELTPNRK
ncbi:MAG TPA: hypothetical protein VJM12_05435 [Pyrinomonadaceae bacterium]|nr:hypothetical protein [Pyrinomonadaceae bacterium]